VRGGGFQSEAPHGGRGRGGAVWHGDKRAVLGRQRPVSGVGRGGGRKKWGARERVVAG
jgi:hypothetical protein